MAVIWSFTHQNTAVGFSLVISEALAFSLFTSGTDIRQVLLSADWISHRVLDWGNGEGGQVMSMLLDNKLFQWVC